MIAAALLLLLQTAPAPGQTQSFGDWMAGCDNGLACEAQSLPWSADGGGELISFQLVLTRPATPDAAPAIQMISHEEEAAYELPVLVDGREIAIATRGDSESDYVFTEEAGDALIAAMIAGEAAQVRSQAALPPATISLSGLSAALRWIDERQRRAGTVTAMVARGEAPAASVGPALPVIRQVRPVEGAEAAPLAEAAARAIADSQECFLPEHMEFTTESHAIAPDVTMTLIACDSGAYNFSSLIYVRRGGGAPEQARFDVPVNWGAEGPPVLVNAWWDPVEVTLHSYAKGRGIGDCGTDQSFVWDGAMFRLTEQRVMEECRGSMRWIIVWRAEVAPAE